MRRFTGKTRTLLFAKLREKRGSITPLNTMAVFLFLIFFGAVFVFVQGLIIAQGTRDAVQSAVIRVVTANYYTSYNGMREGNSGAYSINDSDGWDDSVDTGNVGDELDDLLGTEDDGSGGHAKSDADGIVQYRISDLNVTVDNAPFAPASNTVNLRAKATFNLYFPITLLGINIPVNVPLSVSAGFSPKY